MALVRFGNGISEMRGSIDGVVYSRSRAGATARNRITPVNPNTTFQSLIRSQFNTAVQAWKSVITGPQALVWNEFAAGLSRFNSLGEDYAPAGRQAFIESSMNLQQIEVASLVDAPTDKPEEPSIDLQDVIVVAESAGSALTGLTVNDLVLGPDCTHICWQATLPLPASTTNLARHFKQIAAITAASDNNLLTAWGARLGAVSVEVGQLIGIRLKGINSANGFATSWYNLRAIAVAP